MTFPPLDDFFERSLTGGWFPTAKYVATDTSPCTFGPINSEFMVKWRPVARNAGDNPISDQQNIELAQFGISEAIASPAVKPEFLSEAVDFVNSHWCGTLDCRFGYERVVLDCGAWNPTDLQRKQVAFQDCVEQSNDGNGSVFWPIAWSITGSGQYVGLNLANGEVWSAHLASADSDKLAASLSDFLCGLQVVSGESVATVKSFE